MGKRARIGEAVAVSTEPPKMSKYAAKVAARRKETPEQKAERLGIIVKTVVEEPVKEEPKKPQAKAPAQAKPKKKGKWQKVKIPYELYAGWLATARTEHLRIVRDLEKKMRDEMRRWRQCRTDFSHWAQGAEGTEVMTGYTKNEDWTYKEIKDAEGDGHREEAGE